MVVVETGVEVVEVGAVDDVVVEDGVEVDVVVVDVAGSRVDVVGSRVDVVDVVDVVVDVPRSVVHHVVGIGVGATARPEERIPIGSRGVTEQHRRAEAARMCAAVLPGTAPFRGAHRLIPPLRRRGGRSEPAIRGEVLTGRRRMASAPVLPHVLT